MALKKGVLTKLQIRKILKSKILNARGKKKFKEVLTGKFDKIRGSRY